jgi:hypothetical protein
MQIDLMISGNQPVKAMTYICDLMLFWIVFSLPQKFEPSKSEGCDRYLLILYIFRSIFGNFLTDNFVSDGVKFSRLGTRIIVYFTINYHLVFSMLATLIMMKEYL